MYSRNDIHVELEMTDGETELMYRFSKTLNQTGHYLEAMVTQAALRYFGHTRGET